MELDTGFKDRLKWAIQSKGSNQSELARFLKLSPQAIQQWVAGATSSPRRAHVQEAADFLGVQYEWLAYGRGMMRKLSPTERETAAALAPANETPTEAVLLSHEWEAALLSCLPEESHAAWQRKLMHPSGTAPMRLSWTSDQVLAEIGLYRPSVDTLIHRARQHLWMLAIARESLPPNPARRTILLLAPLEQGCEPPTRHIAALRAEARVLNIEVLHVGNPEQAAAVLLGQEQAPMLPAGADLGLDVPPVL